MPEILITGGGPAGLSAAIALAERGASACVVDRVGGHAVARAECLSQGAAQIMTRLGLSEMLGRALAIKDVQSRWGDAKPLQHGGHPGLGFHGWGIDRADLSTHMRDRLKVLGIDVVTADVLSHTRTPQGWQMECRGSSGIQTLSARYIIDATGRSARIARANGATLLPGRDLVALVWRTAETGPASMLVEARPDGWWYAVPEHSGRSVGFVTSARHANSVRRNPAAFLSVARSEHESKIAGLIEGHALSKAPITMDSRSATLSHMSGPGWLATGDAAAAFDPITSQGLFNALSGGFFAGHAAADAVSGDEAAPLVYAALAQRTADRTHAMTHLQYAALPYASHFWRERGSLSFGADREGQNLTDATAI